MLLGFVTISAFVILGSSERDISTVKSLAETFLILFFISIIISVILAVWSLWGRAIDFSLRETMHLSKSNNMKSFSGLEILTPLRSKRRNQNLKKEKSSLRMNLINTQIGIKY